MGVQLSLLSWHNSLDTSVFFLALSELQKHTGGALSHQTLWPSLSFSQWGWYRSLVLFSPHQHHFCHPLSSVCLLYCDPLTVDRLCFYSLPSGCRPLFCVCVCVYPLQPHRDLYTSLALSACHCYASFVPLSSCEHVFLPMTVCMSIIRPCVNVCAICAFAYRMHVHAYCVCVGLFCQEPAPLGVCPLCPVLCSVDLGIWLL